MSIKKKDHKYNVGIREVAIILVCFVVVFGTIVAIIGPENMDWTPPVREPYSPDFVVVATCGNTTWNFDNGGIVLRYLANTPTALVEIKLDIRVNISAQEYFEIAEYESEVWSSKEMSNDANVWQTQIRIEVDDCRQFSIWRCSSEATDHLVLARFILESSDGTVLIRP